MSGMEDMEAMDQSTSVEMFWGTKLSSKSKVYEYNGESDEEEGIDTVVELRGACLGAEAKNERNIVNLTTEMDGENVTHSILSMRLEKNEQLPLHLSLKPPFKLELVQGSGPVSIVGNMTATLLGDDMSDDELSEEEEEEEVEVPEDKATTTTTKPHESRQKKRPAESPDEKPAKKKNVTKDEEESSDEEDSAMDTLYDLPSSKKNITEEDDDEEEYTDNDDSNDDEEDFEDESDEDDGESDESIEEVKPAPKKGGKFQSAKKPQVGKGQSQTPVPKKGNKPNLKQPSSVPKGDGKKGSAKNTTPSIDQLKKKLLSSPGIPKKLEKFNNMLKNNYKINDDGTKKELWEFIQKSKK